MGMRMRMISTTKSKQSMSSSSSSSSSSMMQSYRSALDSNPVLVKCLTASAISFAADIICQLLVPYMKEKEKEKEKEKGSEAKLSPNPATDIDWSIDWARTAKFSLLGAALNGGLLHYWYYS